MSLFDVSLLKKVSSVETSPKGLHFALDRIFYVAALGAPPDVPWRALDTEQAPRQVRRRLPEGRGGQFSPMVRNLDHGM